MTDDYESYEDDLEAAYREEQDDRANRLHDEMTEGLRCREHKRWKCPDCLT